MQKNGHRDKSWNVTFSTPLGEIQIIASLHFPLRVGVSAIHKIQIIWRLPILNKLNDEVTEDKTSASK